MEVEQLAIQDFLGSIEPFNQLPQEALSKLVAQMEIEYLRRGERIYDVGETLTEIRIIRSGTVEVTNPDGSLYDRYDQGDVIGYRSVKSSGLAERTVETLEDCLFYVQPVSSFQSLLQAYPVVDAHFSGRHLDRIRNAVEQKSKRTDLTLATIVLADLAQPVLAVDVAQSIADTAEQMTSKQVDTALVLDQGALVGIVTDNDFRARVIAHGVNAERPITEIMTTNPLTLSDDAKASQALLMMQRRNIRHIPVLDRHDGSVAGMVAGRDLLRAQSQNPLFLISDIHEAANVNQLKALSAHTPKALVRLVDQNFPAYDIAHAITSIGQAIVRRLIELVMQEIGPAPIPFAFVAQGSMGRREQTAHTDQDNGLILSNDYQEAVHGTYFEKLADFVCTGLDQCGYVFCPGNIMATNPQWRQPLSHWQQQFRQWIMTPEPTALLHASIFFDIRCIAGDASLVGQLVEDILAHAGESDLFQGLMASNAQAFQPPLGFFKGFVLEKNGDNEQAMDMKKRGVVPVIDLARAYALAYGIEAMNTKERLEALKELPNPPISAETLDSLLDAYEFIASSRLEHQARQIVSGQPADNLMPPESLSPLERRYLKDAFEVISDCQNSMARHFSTHRYH